MPNLISQAVLLKLVGLLSRYDMAQLEKNGNFWPELVCLYIVTKDEAVYTVKLILLALNELPYTNHESCSINVNMQLLLIS